MSPDELEAETFANSIKQLRDKNILADIEKEFVKVSEAAELFAQKEIDKLQAKLNEYSADIKGIELMQGDVERQMRRWINLKKVLKGEKINEKSND